jgi:DNA primase
MKYEDVVDVLKLLNVEESSNTSMGQLSCMCPLAKWMHKGGTDNRPSFSIRVGDEPSVYKCFTCGESGTLAQLVESYAALSGEDLKGVAHAIRQGDKPSLRTKLSHAVSSATDHTIRSLSAVEISDSVLDRFKPAESVPLCLDYLSSRNFTKTCAIKFQLLFDPTSTRLVFPIRNQGGGLVGAVGRSLADGPKFYNYFGFESSKCLGGIDKLEERYDRVLLVEGMFDVMRVSQFEGDLNAQAVCTFKAEASDFQCGLLSGLAKPILLCYDGDMAGYKGSAKTFRRLKAKVPFAREVRMPEGSDVGSMRLSDLKHSLKLKGHTSHV